MDTFQLVFIMLVIPYTLHGGGAVSRGFSILPLAADYLCVECQREFLALDIDALTGDSVFEWCARLQSAGVGGGELAWLAMEQARMKARSCAMECAARARDAGSSSWAELSKFVEHLELDRFVEDAVTVSMCKQQRGAHSEPQAESSTWLQMGRKFQICRACRQDRFFAENGTDRSAQSR